VGPNVVEHHASKKRVIPIGNIVAIKGHGIHVAEVAVATFARISSGKKKQVQFVSEKPHKCANPEC
jgi:hypothetical protein